MAESEPLKPLVWVSESELPIDWQKVLDPAYDLRELGVTPVLKIIQPVLWGIIGFLFFGVMFIGGVAMAIHQFRNFATMETADKIMGSVMAVFLMIWLPWFFLVWLRMLRNVRAKRDGRYRIGVFFSEEAVLIRPHPGEVALIPRSCAVDVQTEEFRSENAGPPLITSGFIFRGDGDEGLLHVKVDFLNDDGPGGFNHRVHDWVEGRDFRWKDLRERKEKLASNAD